MKQTLTCLAAVLLIGGCSHPNMVSARDVVLRRGASSDSVRYDAHILIDQFGYRPTDPKFAVLRSPMQGFDAADTFAPGKLYQVRRADNGTVVHSGPITAWNGGAVDRSSGDVAWWYDFSAVKEPGVYYVYDAQRNVRSPVFSVDEHVYREALRAAVHMYYYQRAGIAKVEQYAGKCWTDAAAYVGPNQDSQAHDISDPDNPAKVRDLSGGWFDAGDTNKYVKNAVTFVHQLLTAYEESPAVFTDDFNIPESGNGVPDLIDEVKWETAWLEKMQFSDGGVAVKVGDTNYRDASPPSSDHSPRFYVPECTSSTIASAGMFAHASYVYARFPQLTGDADRLKNDAIRAWENYQRSPSKQTHCDSGEVKVPGADLDAAVQEQLAVVAAIYLFAITGDAQYDVYVNRNYQLLRPFNDLGWMRYGSEQGQALLFYTKLSNADDKLKRAIEDRQKEDVLAGSDIYGVSPNDPYRNSFTEYYWGSNRTRANYGITNLHVKQYGVRVDNASVYVTRALDTLHYLNGVNPFGKVYLSNMYGYGVTNSVNSLFTGWFAAGSKWGNVLTSECGPAPGYMPGGPNAHAADTGVPLSESPPVGQPPQKSYKDWNGPDSSWTISEPDDGYQAAYVQLVAAFAQ